MIQYEVVYNRKIRTRKKTQEQIDLARNIKQSARLKRPTLTRWYIDQLADVLVRQEEKTNANANA